MTQKDSRDLERVQKSALKVILGDKYKSYEEALKTIRIDSLAERRQKICLKFAQQCLRNEKLRDMFPRNLSDHMMKKRNAEKFIVTKALTERFRKSAIPSMQRLLNNDDKEKKKMFKIYIIFLYVSPPWLAGFVTLSLCMRAYLILYFLVV